jgi:hypothetical protein
MSSLKQIDANRRNALKSTGPTTVEGRLRSRSNAIRHGLTAETVIATLEDIDDYEAFEATVIADYDAETAVERELVLRIASVLWRLRRSTLIETGLFETAAENSRGQDQEPSQMTPGGADAPSNHSKMFLQASSESDAAERTGPEFNSKRDIAQCFLYLADLPKNVHVRLSRYEQMLWRQARQLVFTLDTLRRHKRQPRCSAFPFSLR